MSERTIPDNRKESLPHDHADVSANMSPAKLVLEEIRTTRLAWKLCKAGGIPIDCAGDAKNLYNFFDDRIGAPPDIGEVKNEQQARRALWLMEGALTPAGETAPPSGPPPTGDADKKQDTVHPKAGDKLVWLAKAMLLVKDHPDWSDAKIAREVDKSPSTLSRNQSYQAAAALAREKKADPHKGHVKFDPETGLQDVEAYAGDDPAKMDLDD